MKTKTNCLQYTTFAMFLSDPGVLGVQSSFGSRCHKLSEPPCWDLADVTLADEDIISILTDNLKEMWQCKLRNLVAKFATNASATRLLLNLIQVTESTSGPLCLWGVKDIQNMAFEWHKPARSKTVRFQYFNIDLNRDPVYVRGSLLCLSVLQLRLFPS